MNIFLSFCRCSHSHLHLWWAARAFQCKKSVWKDSISLFGYTVWLKVHSFCRFTLDAYHITLNTFWIWEEKKNQQEEKNFWQLWNLFQRHFIVDVTGEKWRKIYVNARMEWHEMKIKWWSKNIGRLKQVKHVKILLHFKMRTFEHFTMYIDIPPSGVKILVTMWYKKQRWKWWLNEILPYLFPFSRLAKARVCIKCSCLLTPNCYPRNERITTYTRYTKQRERANISRYILITRLYGHKDPWHCVDCISNKYTKKRGLANENKKKWSLFNYRQCLKMSTICYGNIIRNKM